MSGSCRAITPLPCATQFPVTVTDAVAVAFVPRAMVIWAPSAGPVISPPSTVHAYVAPAMGATAAIAVPDLHAAGGTCTVTGEGQSAARQRRAAKTAKTTGGTKNRRDMPSGNTKFTGCR